MASSKAKHSISAEKMDAYKRLTEDFPEIEVKGATIPYTSFNGHMFSYFEKDGTFGLRLPKPELEAFLKKYNTSLFISYGIVKKEFALVPETLLLDTAAMKPYFKISFEYIKTLKAK